MMSSFGFGFLLLCAILLAGLSTGAEAKIEPTQFQNNKVYALENQHGGKYLTAGAGGEPTRTGDRGTHTQDQKWRFVGGKDSSGREGWKLVPVIDQPALPTLWQPIYAGHGKFVFRSLSSGKCLEASNRGVEADCEKGNLFQRWYPHPKPDA